MAEAKAQEAHIARVVAEAIGDYPVGKTLDQRRPQRLIPALPTIGGVGEEGRIAHIYVIVM
ncbi:MAG: hypothetical protein ACREQY_11705, partial [Candidatus Binatia bacterium]